LNRSADHSRLLGLLLVVLSGPLLGQTTGSGQANRGLPAANVVTSAPTNNKADDNSFIIGNDDVIAINVWKEPDFSRSLQVRSDGKISMPLLGEVQAAGLTPSQLEQDIAGRLLKFITKPQVTVMVEQVNSKKVNVLGQVTKPGSYSLALAPTVVDAIAAANGPKEFAKQKSIYILRQSPGGGQTRIVFNYKDFLKGKTQNVKLEPHDTVVVP
jgi:polysaccharide export outer membrane protein